MRWRPVSDEELTSGLRSLANTVIDCARDLPFDEALAVADSALRQGRVEPDDLVRHALALPTTGRRKALRVAAAADARAANPFESVLRAIAIEAGLELVPQYVINDRGYSCRPDLVDPVRRLVVEADSFEFHASRAGLRKDCRRYTALGLRGWTVLRFSWEDVMFNQEYVRRCLIVASERRLL